MIIDRGKPCDSWASPDCWFFVAPFSTLYPSARTKPLLFFSSGHLSCKVPGCTMLYISWWLGERRQRLFTVTMTLWLNWWHNQRHQDLNCTITDSNGVLRHYAPSATPPFARKARKCGSKPDKQFWKNEKPLGREIKWHKSSGQRILYLNQSDLSYPLRILSLHPLARLRFKDWFLGSPKIDSLLLPDIRGTHEPHEL